MMIKVYAKLALVSEGQKLGLRSNECKKCLFGYLMTKCIIFIATGIV